MTNTPLPNHMLAVRFGHLGDVVLSTGPLRRLAQTLGVRLHVLTRPAFADIFTHNPHVERVVAFDPSGLSAKALTTHFRRLAGEYKGAGLLDLHGTLRTRLLSALWQGPVLRHPKYSLERRLFLASGGRLFREELLRFNVPQRYALAFCDKAQVPDRSLLLPQIYLSEAELREANERLAGIFGPNARPVALHPFATHPLKSPPTEFWRETAKLLEAQGIPVLALGLGEPLWPNAPHDLCNCTSLRQSCAVLARCRALISGDSGPMHLASAVGTPVVALFGPTTREWGFYPEGPLDRVIERDLPCRPCSLHGKFRCPDNGRCLAGIPAQELLETILGLP